MLINLRVHILFEIKIGYTAAINPQSQVRVFIYIM